MKMTHCLKGIVMAAVFAFASTAWAATGSDDFISLSDSSYSFTRYDDTANNRYTYVFPSAKDSLTVTAKKRLQFSKALIVGGGGGGGCGADRRVGGGGGGGGVIEKTALTTIVEKNGTFSCTIGAGGSGSSSIENKGSNGGNSSLTIGSSTETAIGGGGGGSGKSKAGSSGGSGGGAGGSYASSDSGGAGTDGQGNKGGNSDYYDGFGDFDYPGGGGGGGAGAAGSNASSSNGGSGGDGVDKNYTGTSHCYGSGGGGGETNQGNKNNSGGKESGGTGASNASGGYSAGAGTDGLGGGGGGGGGSGKPNGAAGGCGTVIVVLTVLPDPEVTFTPTTVAHTTATVYTNGVVLATSSSYKLAANSSNAKVVYTAAAEYRFADGSTAVTNTITTSSDPATASAPSEPVRYVYWVSASGNDSNEGSATAPLATVQSAIVKSNGRATTIYVMTDLVEAPFSLSAALTSGTSITITSNDNNPSTTYDRFTVYPSADGSTWYWEIGKSGKENPANIYFRDIIFDGRIGGSSGTEKYSCGGIACYGVGELHLQSGFIIRNFMTAEGNEVRAVVEKQKGKLYVENGSLMTGNTVRAGKSDYPTNAQGVINVGTDAELHMTGGTITGNTAVGKTSSMINLGTNIKAYITGGAITNNTMYAEDSYACYKRMEDATTPKQSDYYFSGSAIVYDNLDTNGAQRNVHIPTNAKVNVGGALTGSAKIGLSAAFEVTSGQVLVAEGSDYTLVQSDVSHIKMDRDADYHYIFDSAKLYVAKHTWSLTTVAAATDRIYAYCPYTGCPHSGSASDVSKAISVRLVTPDAPCGTAYSAASFEGIDFWSEAGLATPTLTYAKSGTSSYSAAAPTLANDYTAKATIDTYTAKSDFTLYDFVRVVPDELVGAKVDVFTNGVAVAKSADGYLVISNSTDVTVVYTATNDFYFSGYATSKTCTGVDTTKNPAVITGTPAAPTQHKHCICGDGTCEEGGHSHEDLVWKMWTSTTSLPTTAGNWFLVNDVTLTAEYVPVNGVNLCLNGHVVTQTGSARVIKVTNDGSVSVSKFAMTDCQGNGAITGGTTTGLGAGVLVTRKDGSYTSSFSMFGGIICGNAATTTEKQKGDGGGVAVDFSCSFYMYGGVISNNTATVASNLSGSGRGGGLFVIGGDTGVGEAYIYGGDICHNTASRYGGGIEIGSGNNSVHPYLFFGGKARIFDNQSGFGGGISGDTGSKIDIDGGEVFDNRAVIPSFGAIGGDEGKGGGMALYCGPYTIKNCKVYNNHAEVRGGGILYQPTDTAVLKGLMIVTNNTSVTSSPIYDNFYLETATARATVNDMTPGSVLGITVINPPTTAGGKRAITGTGAREDRQFFSSDVEGLVVTYDSDGGVISLLKPSVVLEILPKPLEHATGQAYWDGLPVAPDPNGKYYIPQDATDLAIVYKADDYWYFSGYSQYATNEVDTSTNPATNSGTLPTITQHKHCICGTGTCDAGGHSHSDIVWKAWYETDALPTTAGNWFLVNDVTLTTTYNPASGVNLCLNGKKVTQTTAASIVEVSAGRTFTATDCSGNKGMFTSGGVNLGSSNAGVKNLGTFNFYAGVITNVVSTTYGGGVLNTGTMNMYGGQIVACSVDKLASDDKKTASGGGVYNEGTLNLTGGEISGCKTQVKGKFGGGVINGSTTGKMNMTGGVICNNPCYGIVSGLPLVITGGAITNNTSFGVYANNAPANGWYCEPFVGGDVVIKNNGAINLLLNGCTSGVLSSTPLKTGASIYACTGNGATPWNPGVVATNAVSTDLDYFTTDFPDEYQLVYEASTHRILEMVFDVEVKEPSPAIANTSFKVLTNGVETAKSGGKYLVPSNATDVVVVYVADDGYFFDDGSTAKTNTVNASTNPATVNGTTPKAPKEKLVAIEYTMPVYVGGIASNGIESWATDSVKAYSLVSDSSSAVTWGTAGATNWFVVTNNVNLSGGVVCKGHVNLILCPSSTLTVTNTTDHQAGIQTDAAGSFTIYGQPDGAGTLKASTSNSGAAIGGGYDKDGINITINAGTVIANGGLMAAGIGGGYQGSARNIVVNGGNVTATGGEYGAGIGGGEFDEGSENFVINGGTVVAQGGMQGAGIGGGSGFSEGQSGRDASTGDAKNIVINAGTVTAKGGDRASGIGAGSCGAGTAIAINGGTVIAEGGKQSAAIGGGDAHQEGTGIGSNIVINAGTVTAKGGIFSAGIGGGMGGGGYDITIAGGTVSAFAPYEGAAIGGGTNGVGSSISIVGGTVYAFNEGYGDSNMIGSGSGGAAASGNTVTDGAKVFFNLYKADAAVPEDFDRFTILSVYTMNKAKVLVGGVTNWTAASTFTLTNSAYNVTKPIKVNGDDVQFNSRLVTLSDAGDKLTLTPYQISTLYTPEDVNYTTKQIYTNGTATTISSYITVRQGTSAYVVYTANDSYEFDGGVTVVTNWYDTSVNPATFTPTAAPKRTMYYVSSSGSDANEGSPTAPFATITNALVKSAGRKTTIHVMTDLVQDPFDFSKFGVANTTDITIMSDDNDPSTTDDQFVIYPSKDGTTTFWTLGQGDASSHYFNAALCFTNIVFDGRIGGSTGTTKYGMGAIKVIGNGTTTLADGFVVRNFQTAEGNSVYAIIEEHIGKLYVCDGALLTSNTIRRGQSSYTSNAQAVINVGGEASLYITGGLITGNTATGTASSMINLGSKCKAYITGGAISNNVMYSSDSFACYKRMENATTPKDSTYYFGGSIIVWDNKDASGNQKNVHVPHSFYVQLSEALTGVSKVGIHAVDTPAVGDRLLVAQGDGTYTAVENDAKHVAMDRDASFHNIFDTGKIYVAQHTWQYAKDAAVADTFYAYCPFAGCQHSGSPSDLTKALSLQLVTPDADDGVAYADAKFVGTNDWVAANLAYPTLTYATRGSASFVATAPSTAGDYTAKATCVTGSVDQVITAVSDFKLNIVYVEVKEAGPKPDHTTFSVLTNGVAIELTGGKYLVPSNSPNVKAVYKADAGYFFDDGSTAKTNTVDTSTNPATVKGTAPTAPHQPLKYTAPVYVDNIASNGIAYWTTNKVYGYTVVTGAASAVTWGTAGVTNYFAVTNDITITGGVVCKGDVNLILCEGAKLFVTNGASGKAGIRTDASGSFTIYGQPDGAGELTAWSGEGGAGIGGSENEAGSHITINGGTVTAVGWRDTGSGTIGGAGIGGGTSGEGSDITINGGTVVARGIYQSAAIGGGDHGNGSLITINGGTVTAVNAYSGAGIGGGRQGDGSYITVNGGTIKANSRYNGAAIGGGYNGSGSYIALNGGTIWLSDATSDARLIGSGKSGSEGTGNHIADAAKVFFNLNTYSVVTPEIDTRTIMTSPTQDTNRVIMNGGFGTVPATFAITNSVGSPRSDVIEVNGPDVHMARRMLSLTYASGVLKLSQYSRCKIESPESVVNTEVTVYTNNAAVTTPIYVRKDMSTKVVYVADPGYYFDDGTTAKTNTVNTSSSTAVYPPAPKAPQKPIKYTAPVYVDNIASNGIAYWTTNKCYSYTVVTSAASKVTWGAASVTNWFAVTNDVEITGGVVCKGDVNLILCEGAKLFVTNAASDKAGIQTDASGSFAIFGQPDGAGELAAFGGENGAGIGGGDQVDGLNITINGGKVTANGGTGAAGIGGGNGREGKNIVINAGSVTAIGGELAAAIGGGLGGKADGVTINGGNILVSSDSYAQSIGSGKQSSESESVVISSAANVLFDVSGQELTTEPMFDGFAIMTPATQTVDRVLVAGCANWTAATTFVLTNTATAATNTIEVNGRDLYFANRFLSLTNDTNKLTLKAVEAVVIDTNEIDNTTFEIYRGDEKLEDEPYLVPSNSTPVKIIYKADDGYYFDDGSTEKTNTIDTSTNPATIVNAPLPPHLPLQYTAPVYVDNIASNGVAYWTTNKVYAYTVVQSAESAVTWGETDVTNWYAVTGADVTITGGVTCAGYVNLILCEGSKLTIRVDDDDELAAIATDCDGSFAIYGQPDGAGELDAKGATRAAAIGGSKNETGDNITINGGTITAVGVYWAAGIGGGYGHDGVNIVINAGTVTAIGGELAAGIGGGLGGKADGVTINGGNILVSSDSYAQPIGSGKQSSESESVVISSAANVLFDVSGQELTTEPMFDGFAIMTPATQTVDRVLVGGCDNWTAATTFVLTNSATGATDSIKVNGDDVFFAERLINLPFADDKLTLKAYEYSVVTNPPDVAHMSNKVYTNGVELALGSGIKVRCGTPIYTVYTADEKYCYPDSSTVVTNWYDTSSNPATLTPPAAPFIPVVSVTSNSVTTLYGDISNAWGSAKNGRSNIPTTLKLLADVSIDATLEADAKTVATIDLNGKTLSGTSDLSSSLFSGVYNSGDFGDEWWSTLTITNGTLTGGRASAIYSERGMILTLEKVVLTGNSSSYGGAINGGYDSKILVKDCVFTNNVADYEGGAIWIDYHNNTKCTLVRTLITGNTAGYGGGGVHLNVSECLAAGTMIRLADGTETAIENVKEGDLVATFDHEGGTNSSARVYYAFKGTGKATPFTLEFDAAGGADGVRTLSIVGYHDLLEQGSRKYVTITGSNVGQYIGAKFYGVDGAWHTLTNVTMGAEKVEYYSLYAAQHQNVYANGMLTVCDDVDYLLNLYELDENLKADAEQFAADIAQYGIMSYEAAAAYGMNREWYENAGAKYLNIAIGKQLVSKEYVKELFKSVGDVATDGKTMPLMMMAMPTIDDGIAKCLTLGEGVVVTNNLAYGKTSNIYLGDYNIALLADHDGINAGVAITTGTGKFTTTSNVSETDVALFTSDNTDYIVAFNPSGYLELCPPPEEVLPTPINHTSSTVTTNDVEVIKDDDGKYIVPSNTLVRVVYTITDDDYVFEGSDDTIFTTDEFPADGTPGTPEALMPPTPIRVWFDSVETKIDTREKIVIGSPDEVLPIAYSTNFFGEAANAVASDESYVSQQRDVALNPTSVVKPIAETATIDWKPVEGEYGRYEMKHVLCTNDLTMAYRTDLGYIYYSTNVALQVVQTTGGSIAAFTNEVKLAAVSELPAFSDIVLEATPDSKLWTFDGWMVTNGTGAAVALVEPEPALTNRFELPLSGAGVVGNFRYIGVTVSPEDVVNATWRIYQQDEGGDWVAAADSGVSAIVVSNTPTKIVYSSNSGCYFVNGTTNETVQVNTGVEPAELAYGVKKPKPAGAPAVMVKSAIPRYPWNGKVDVEYRAKFWPGAEYEAKLLFTVDDLVITNTVDFGTKSGSFIGIETIDLREQIVLPPKGRAKAEFIVEEDSGH